MTRKLNISGIEWESAEECFWIWYHKLCINMAHFEPIIGKSKSSWPLGFQIVITQDSVWMPPTRTCQREQAWPASQITSDIHMEEFLEFIFQSSKNNLGPLSCIVTTSNVPSSYGNWDITRSSRVICFPVIGDCKRIAEDSISCPF